MPILPKIDPKSFKGQGKLLLWDGVAGATQYHFKLMPLGSAFNVPANSSGNGGFDTSDPQLGLNMGQKYSVEVRPGDGTPTSIGPSETISFEIATDGTVIVPATASSPAPAPVAVPTSSPAPVPPPPVRSAPTARPATSAATQPTSTTPPPANTAQPAPAPVAPSATQSGLTRAELEAAFASYGLSAVLQQLQANATIQANSSTVIGALATAVTTNTTATNTGFANTATATGQANADRQAERNRNYLIIAIITGVILACACTYWCTQGANKARSGAKAHAFGPGQNGQASRGVSATTNGYGSILTGTVNVNGGTNIFNGDVVGVMVVPFVEHYDVHMDPAPPKQTPTPPPVVTPPPQPAAPQVQPGPNMDSDQPVGWVQPPTVYGVQYAQTDYFEPGYCEPGPRLGVNLHFGGGYRPHRTVFIPGCPPHRYHP